ncbi:Magnesium transporter ALR1 [Candida viswanathii]|uniref:Magnesium transporter ALR1 n=1 Tax=Candida viswanathii TaxID=5486 RepID=A0A367YFJ3_9ASCO|nr:Magnesium transporter ALR1 [Candida viswanathii]
MSDTESFYQHNGTNHEHEPIPDTDEVLNDHRNQLQNESAISDDEDPLHPGSAPASASATGTESTPEKKRLSRKNSSRKGTISEKSGASVQPQQHQRAYMTSLRKDFYLGEEDDSSLPLPIINNGGKSRRKSQLDALPPIIKKRTGRSNSNNFENDLVSPMTKLKTNDSDDARAGRRPSRSSIDSEADSHASRTSQETEEDVCFPMVRDHIRVNGIDFDEIDEFIREEREEKQLQQQYMAKNALRIEEFQSLSATTSSSRHKQSIGSTAALKYTPKNILKNTFSRFEEVHDTSSSDEIELKARDDGSSEQVKFGGARISDGSNGSLPDRFSFFHSESEETVHAPDIPSLVAPGQSARDLFKDGEETWWLDCTCPTDSEMKMLAKAFGIHPLTAEDIRMQETREKVELFKSYYFVCFHTFEPDKESEDYLEPINVYIVVFRDGILTFHFSPINHPANVRRRVRQLRDYVDVSADWLCYALIDEITDGFAPVIHGIEYEADAIEDAVFTARDTDFGSMLQRIGESRRKVMTLMRLLSGKADVIKMFAKRCQEESISGFQRQQQRAQQQQQQQQQQTSPYPSAMNLTGLETVTGGVSFGPGPGISSSPPPVAPPAWQPPSNTDNARPRADIALYLGDIQDHIITMFQNLLAYEKIFSRSHSNYLAQLQVESFNSNNKITEMFSKVTLIGTMLVPLNLVTGLFGMNVRVPGENGSNLGWFFGIVGVLVVIIVSSFFFAKWWLGKLNQDDPSRKPVFNSRRSIRSLGLKRHSAKSIVSFPNKYE